MKYSNIKCRLADLGLEIEAASGMASGSTLTDLSNWRSDLDEDVFTVAVVGEFNKGKSTLLNALFAIDLLPTGITPTTAVVTLIRHSATPQAVVRYRDGKQKQIQLSSSTLRQFVTSDSEIASGVEYVEIGLPHPLLQDGIVYVDTPGVSDLSRDRTEVTYGFVPRADSVLFVLDSTAPVTKSEMDFLTTAILKERAGSLVFASNFSDLLDDDARPGAEIRTRKRLSAAVDLPEPTVCLVSAKKGLDPLSFNKSGINELTEHLRAVTSEGPRRVEKAIRMRDRLLLILESARGDLEKKKHASRLSAENLKRETEAIEEQWRRREIQVVQIREWVQDRETEVLAMTEKSLETFFRNLYEDSCDLVQAYSGPDFKSMIESQLPIQVKKRCKAWVDGHSDTLRAAVMRLSSELTEALCREFKTTMPLLEPHFVSAGIGPDIFQAASPEKSHGRLYAGLIAGGAGALLAVVGLPILAPLVGLAAFPYLANHLEKSELEEVKRNFMPELDRAFYSAARSMRDSVLGFLHTEIVELQKTAESKHSQLLDDARRTLEPENFSVRRDINVANDFVRSFENQISCLDEIQTRLSELLTEQPTGELL